MLPVPCSDRLQTLTVTLAGSGRGLVSAGATGTRSSCGTTFTMSGYYGNCAGRYQPNADVELDVTPDRGSTFTG